MGALNYKGGSLAGVGGLHAFIYDQVGKGREKKRGKNGDLIRNGLGMFVRG